MSGGVLGSTAICGLESGALTDETNGPCAGCIGFADCCFEDDFGSGFVADSRVEMESFSWDLC